MMILFHNFLILQNYMNKVLKTNKGKYKIRKRRKKSLMVKTKPYRKMGCDCVGDDLNKMNHFIQEEEPTMRHAKFVAFLSFDVWRSKSKTEEVTTEMVNIQDVTMWLRQIKLG